MNGLHCIERLVPARATLRKHAVKGAVLFLWGAMTAIPAVARELPPEVRTVQQYIMAEGQSDYPELFGDRAYRTRIEDVLVTDLDGDGEKDVVLQFQPHYRQSPTIVIYRVSVGGKVTRMTEGLAPGPLVPISGDYLDSHALGMAVDFEIGGKQQDAEAREGLVRTSLDRKASIVAYRTFFHMDMREGYGTYIDMSHFEEVPGGKNCEGFEFSAVDRLTAGRLKGGGKHNYLVAQVGEVLYVYRIEGHTPDGRLKKKMWVLKPDRLGKLLRRGGEEVAYQDRDGVEHNLALPR